MKSEDRECHGQQCPIGNKKSARINVAAHKKYPVAYNSNQILQLH